MQNHLRFLLRRDELKQSLLLAVPVIIAQVGHMMMGIIDTYVIGQVSSYELAGVAAGNGVFWTACTIGIGILFGLDPIISQAHGRGQLEDADKALGQGLILSLLISTLSLPLLSLFSEYFHLTGAKPTVVEAAKPYLDQVIYSFPFVMFFTCMQRYWQSLSIALPVTLIVIAANVVNYFADLTFVHGLLGFDPMGAKGVGYATLICRFFMFACITIMSIMLWLRRNKDAENSQHFSLQNIYQFNKLRFLALLKIGTPIAMQIALEVSAFGLTTIIVANLGALDLAAHHVSLLIASFTFMFPLGLSSATSVRVGFHRGRQLPSDSRYAGWLGIILGIIIMAVFALILFVFPKTLLGIFTQDRQVIEIGVGIIGLCALFQVFDGIQVITAGALRGIEDTKTPLISNLIAHYFIGLPLGTSLCFYFGLGLSGLWIGLASGLFTVSLINLWFWHIKTRHFL